MSRSGAGRGGHRWRVSQITLRLPDGVSVPSPVMIDLAVALLLVGTGRRRYPGLPPENLSQVPITSDKHWPFRCGVCPGQCTGLTINDKSGRVVVVNRGRRFKSCPCYVDEALTSRNAGQGLIVIYGCLNPPPKTPRKRPDAIGFDASRWQVASLVV